MRRIVALAVVLLLVIAACGGGTTTQSDSGAQQSESPEIGNETTESQATDQQSNNPWEDYVSPIAVLLGYDNLDSEDQQAEFVQREREAQDTIRQCMAAEGFEYQPIVESELVFFSEGDDLSPEERAVQYGYGFSTYFGEEQDFVEEEAYQDPNQDYIDSLGEAERDAYFRALYGDQPEFDETLSEEELEQSFENFVPTGCQSEAYEDLYGGGEFETFYQTFGDQLDGMYERIQADPRIVAEREEWVACMADAGYAFGSQEEIYEDLQSRMDPIWNSQSFPGEDLTEEQFAAMSEDELEALYSQRPQFDEELLAEVREYELELAAVDISCPGTSFLPSQAFFEVQAEYEQAFIDENADQIRELIPDSDF